MNYYRLINIQRKKFSAPHGLTDYKDLHLSTSNLAVQEIFDMILWYNANRLRSYGKKSRNKKTMGQDS